MSIFSVNVHFHDGELAKLAAYLVDGYVAAVQCVLQKVKCDGGYEKYERRHNQALRNMALMKKYLTPAQTTEIRESLQVVARSQARLHKEDETLSKKERLGKYKIAVKKFEEVVWMTSQDVARDLGSNGGHADAYRMALACTAADIDAMRMMDEVIAMFESVDVSGGKAIPVNPPNAPQSLKASQPPKESKRAKEPVRGKPPQESKPSTGKRRPKKGKQQASADRVPAALMAGMAERLTEATLSS